MNLPWTLLIVAAMMVGFWWFALTALLGAL